MDFGTAMAILANVVVVVGGLFGIFSLQDRKFDQVYTKIEAIRDSINEKVDREIKDAHKRIDQFYTRRSRGE